MKKQLPDLYQVSVDDVQAQYRDTNIQKLITGIADIKNRYLKKGFESLKNDNLLITTAKEDGLDLWGNLLHFYRHIPTDGGADAGINYFNFNNKNFVRLQFKNPNQKDYGTLPDDIYRRLLTLLYQGMFILNTIPNLNSFVNEFFTEYDRIVIRDALDMSFVVYVFQSGNPMPIWLKWILSNYDLLPRPAGVGSAFVEGVYPKTFGFAPRGTTDKWYFENIGAFNSTNFIKPKEI